MLNKERIAEEARTKTDPLTDDVVALAKLYWDSASDSPKKREWYEWYEVWMAHRNGAS